MENKIKYESSKMNDWIKTKTLTKQEVDKLISEKIERAKIQLLATQTLLKKAM